jgi:hypothetical protein
VILYYYAFRFRSFHDQRVYSFLVYLTALSSNETTQRRIVLRCMNNKLGRIWKEADVA